MVSGLGPGDLPGDPPKPAAERHVLRFEVDGDTYALWREAVKKVRAEYGGDMSEDEAVAAIARAVLEGPADEGRASYQVAMTLCESCGLGTIDGRGEPIVVEDEVVEMALCDNQYIGAVDATHGAPHAPHVGQGGEPQRAKQTIPPAKRRLVMRRDHGQCVVPGCASSTFVDVHHLHWRKDGGQHDIDGMCVLCGGHHRAVHRGTLRVLGSPSTGVRFFHADGTPYGSRQVSAGHAAAATGQFVAHKENGFDAEAAWRAVRR